MREHYWQPISYQKIRLSIGSYFSTFFGGFAPTTGNPSADTAFSEKLGMLLELWNTNRMFFGLKRAPLAIDSS